jgi:hypothetical protein
MWMRRYMVDQLNQDYIRLAKAKGMSSTQVAFKHILRNAFISYVPVAPDSILFTISGSLYIEALYSIPGMGGFAHYGHPAAGQHPGAGHGAFLLGYERPRHAAGRPPHDSGRPEDQVDQQGGVR